MRKNVRKLKIQVESLRILEGPNAFGAGTAVGTCQPSCPATCGNIPATTDQVAAIANSARVCCV